MIGFAGWEMRGQLSELWQICFHEPKRYPRYFLYNGFRPRDCLVYTVSGTVVSAVYLLPAFIAAGEKRVRAHYIFAAGTLPAYRSRGCMSSLLACAAMIGAKRGDRYSVVLPAGRDLVPYYTKLGYREFFQVRRLSVPFGRLEELAAPRGNIRLVADARSLNSARNAALRRRNGSVLWSGGMFHFIAGMSAVYGDRLVSSRTGGRFAYALCRKQGNACDVLELIADARTLPGLAASMLREAPADVYRMRLPCTGGPFEGEGETGYFGMIRPIGGACLQDIDSPAPYFGMGMD